MFDSIKDTFHIKTYQGSEGLSIPRCRTGSMLLDRALGGGWPAGRIIEISGWESSGKTSLTMQSIAQDQQEGYHAVFIDAEYSYNREFAEKTLGLNPDMLHVSHPECGEEAFESILGILKHPDSEYVRLIVVDSVAALTPKAELEDTMGSAKMGLHARMMSQGMRKLAAEVGKSNKVVIFINQFREKIGVMFGNPTTVTGGNALKFYASIRLELSKGSAIKDKNDIIGYNNKIKVVKSKVSMPGLSIDVPFYLDRGYYPEQELLNLAVEKNVITKAGSWFSFDGVKLGQGEVNVAKVLEDNPDLFEEIKSKTFF